MLKACARKVVILPNICVTESNELYIQRKIIVSWHLLKNLILTNGRMQSVADTTPPFRAAILEGHMSERVKGRYPNLGRRFLIIYG